MKTISATLIAAIASASLLAAPAMAQQTPAPADAATENPADIMTGMLAQLNEKLRPVAALAGIEHVDLTTRLEPLFRAAIPSVPTNGEDWSFNFNFNNVHSVTDDGSATDGRQALLRDAQACAEAYPAGGRVVYFRRIRQSGLVGQQCVLAAYQDDLGVLISLTYAEGLDRHVVGRYDVSASVTGSPEGVQAMLEPVLEANVILAIAFADLGIEQAARAVAGDGEASAED